MFSTWKFLWSVQLIYTFYFNEWSVAAFLFQILMEIKARIRTRNLCFCENVQWGFIRNRLFSSCLFFLLILNLEEERHILYTILTIQMGVWVALVRLNLKNRKASALKVCKNRKRTEKYFLYYLVPKLFQCNQKKLINVINSIILMGVQRPSATKSGRVWRAV